MKGNEASRLKKIKTGMVGGAVVMLAPLPAAAATLDDQVLMGALLMCSSAGSAVATVSTAALNRLTREQMDSDSD